MFKILYRCLKMPYKNHVSQIIKRDFLSNAYQCTEAWNNRLQNPIFQNVDPQALYYRLTKDFKDNNRINMVEVDTFINCLSDDKYLIELENILIHLRRVPESVLFQERGSHTVIRFLLENSTTEKILEILGDRITYGIFPDYYTCNLLMDKFLNSNDSVAAVKIAVLQMLQEDFNHPITNAMAVYSCYNYLASSDVWEVIYESEEDSDEEVVKVRLPYLRNPYFDDHFDIEVSNHLVGKTLWLFGRSLSSSLGLSSELVGLILYEKYDKCIELLKNCIKNNSKIYSEAITLAADYLKTKPKQITAESTTDTKESEDSKSAENLDSQTNSENTLKNEVSKLLAQINKSKLIDGNLLDISKKLVSEVVLKQEQIDIENQCEMFKNWEIERENDIKEENERAAVENLQWEIEKVKNDLAKEERKLFFFDNEFEIMEEVEKQEEKMKKVEFFKSKHKKHRKPENLEES